MYEILIVKEKLQIWLLCEYLRISLTIIYYVEIKSLFRVLFFLVLTSVYLPIAGEEVTVASHHTHTHTHTCTLFPIPLE